MTSTRTVSLLLLLAQLTWCYEYVTKTFSVPVDHFSFSNNQSFNMRYLFNDSYWNKDDGPIFFYTGNEGSIEMFANNTGFMWDIAQSFEAMVVFAEHRYYGQSLPFGNKSFTEPQYTGYLTSQQALADYADLLMHLSHAPGRTRKLPVVAFGGSYGGMLAAYIRMKYPHLVDGAIAASAPIWQFTNMTPCGAFSRIVSADFKAVSPVCYDVIRSSWDTISSVTSSADGLSWLTKEWHLCKPLQSSQVKSLKSWLNEVYINLAMVDYPYPSDFLAPLPAYPVQAFCQPLVNASNMTGKTLLQQLYHGISVYLNHTGNAKCLDIAQDATADLGEMGWDYQSCTEMVMPICADGKADMFEPQPWDFEQMAQDCFTRWKVWPQPYLAETNYGGKRIQSASNIIFSNGLLDPWSSGGVMKNLSDSLLSIIIPEGAHHLDLRAAHPADPASVRQARKIYQKLILKWIRYE